MVRTIDLTHEDAKHGTRDKLNRLDARLKHIKAPHSPELTQVVGVLKGIIDLLRDEIT